ncbi:MAG: stage II sporulation protein M [Actinobacteria bacterium]|nr:stage II sporulation protein M [Actinomycetota bacterium]
MDVDVFATAHAAEWARLDQLAAKRRLTGAEADQLVQLYRRGATHLSVLRASAPDPALVANLSVTLVKARARIASPHDVTWRQAVRFLTHVIPAALYRVRWWSVVVTAVCLLIAVVGGYWTSTHPDVLATFVSPADQKRIAEEAFASYYSEYPNASFAAQVWTNNAFIAALCIATGITGIYPAQILFENSLYVGLMGALMHNQGADWIFWSLILPHGLLELSCVFVAGAAGMRLCWSWLVPGDRTRAQSLAEEGRTTIVVVIALVIGLGVSGLLEGFITPSELNPWVKIAIGAVVAAAFWVVMFVQGRRAVEEGTDPGLTEEEAASMVAVAG